MGICHSSQNQLKSEQCNMLEAPVPLYDYQKNAGAKESIEIASDNYINNYLYMSHNLDQTDIAFKYRTARRPSVENKIRYEWTKILSVPKTIKNISQPMLINDNEILIIPKTIKNDLDFDEIHTYLYSYNMTTNSYSKLTKYPSDFPRGIHATTVDVDNGIIYIFTRNGYILNYNIKQNKWKWEIIHGIGKYDRRTFKDNTCAVVCDHQLYIITNKQHLSWNKNTKEFKLLHRYDFANYSSMLYVQNNDTILLLGAHHAANADNMNLHTSDMIYSYSLKSNQWRKLKNKLPFGVWSFGCTLTVDQKYILIFGGNQLPNDSEYDGILIIDTKDFSVRESRKKCPTEGAVYVCDVVEYQRMDLVLCGLLRKYWRVKMFEDVKGLSNDIVGLLKMFYCVEMVHLFDRKKGDHWKIQVDGILV